MTTVTTKSVKTPLTTAEAKRRAAHALMDAHSEGVTKLDKLQGRIPAEIYDEAETALNRLWETANDWYGEANDEDGGADDDEGGDEE